MEVDLENVTHDSFHKNACTFYIVKYYLQFYRKLRHEGMSMLIQMYMLSYRNFQQNYNYKKKSNTYQKYIYHFIIFY